VSGLFDKVQQTYKNLLFLYYIFYPRLTLQINTTIFDYNYRYFEEIYHIIKRDFFQANFAFEVMRGSYDAFFAKPITIEMYEKLIETATKLNDPLLERSLWIHRIAIKTLKQKKQIIPCNGGSNFIVLDHMGNLAPCEILPSIANIRNSGYNFLDIKNSADWKKSVQNIKNGKCYCTHMCFLGSSANDNWNKLKAYIKKHENRN
jgi:MoaA/NifB/PqqE/SkfB family radical SAM enzyme